MAVQKKERQQGRQENNIRIDLQQGSGCGSGKGVRNQDCEAEQSCLRGGVFHMAACGEIAGGDPGQQDQKP